MLPAQGIAQCPTTDCICGEILRASDLKSQDWCTILDGLSLPWCNLTEASHLAGTTEKQRWHVPSQQSRWQEHDDYSERGLEKPSRVANTLPRKAVRRPCATWMRCDRQCHSVLSCEAKCAKGNDPFDSDKAPLLQKRMHTSYWRQTIQACCSLGISCHLSVQQAGSHILESLWNLWAWGQTLHWFNILVPCQRRHGRVTASDSFALKWVCCSQLSAQQVFLDCRV